MKVVHSSGMSLITKHQILPEIPSVAKVILTEDLGKTVEMGICLLYGIDYDGKYKYKLSDALEIKTRFDGLKSVFPYEIKHIAKNGNKYDFVRLDDATEFLSIKTTKKDGKVCPQVIGQPTKKKFCEYFNIDILSDVEQIKGYICENIYPLLNSYVHNTFDCPVVYYNKHKNILLFVKLIKSINWTNYDIQFTHKLKNKKWNESSSIKINDITIGEFQIHNKRDGIKFRWCFEKLLKMFDDHYEIIIIP